MCEHLWQKSWPTSPSLLNKRELFIWICLLPPY